MLHVLFNNFFYRFIFYDTNSSSSLTNIHSFTILSASLIAFWNLISSPQSTIKTINRKKFEKILTPSVKTIDFYTNEVEPSNNCEVSIQDSAPLTAWVSAYETQIMHIIIWYYNKPILMWVKNRSNPR